MIQSSRSETLIQSSPQQTIQSVVEQFVREELSHENAHIAGAVWSMLDAGGKRLRPRITMLAGLVCNATSPEDPVLASYMELIHVATLIHDDVLDNADLRRGRESTNHAFGNRFSVLAGDYLFSWVFKKITQGYAAPIPTILAAMLSDICNGEVKQLRAAGDIGLTTDRYHEIIGKKTAELFAACAEVGAIKGLLAGGHTPGAELRQAPQVRALREYGRLFGLAFQIRDDLYDVTRSDAELGKPSGSDVREKKVTLPLIVALQQGGDGFRRDVEQLFAFDDLADTQAKPLLARVITGMRRQEVVRTVQAAIGENAGAAVRVLEEVPYSPAREELAGLAQRLGQEGAARSQ
jgi:octaprenyl-diphosphate synthase